MTTLAGFGNVFNFEYISKNPDKIKDIVQLTILKMRTYCKYS